MGNIPDAKVRGLWDQAATPHPLNSWRGVGMDGDGSELKV